MYVCVFGDQLCHNVRDQSTPKFQKMAATKMLLILNLFCLQDDNVQLLKEERCDGAIYDIYVKKVNHHTSVNECISTRNYVVSSYANSTFYTELLVQLFFSVFSVFGI